MKKISILLIFITGIFTACTNSIKVVTQPTVERSPTSTVPVATVTQTVVDTPVNTLAPTATTAMGDWKILPIVPSLSPEMVAVYQLGVAAGRDPNRFSKIGDCQNITTYFLAEFDSPSEYRLGSDYAYLQAAIDHFAGSWSRDSLAVHSGMNVAAVQNPFWTLTPRPADCRTGESPMACEIRVYDPSIVIISMEESWAGDIVRYDNYMRLIVQYVISQNVVPILATRAEVPDSQNSINAVVARIAYDYHLPLWNFWAAAEPLPSSGLTSDGFHLTWAAPFFDDPQRMEKGWPWRNLTSLKAINSVWRGAIAGH